MVSFRLLRDGLCGLDSSLTSSARPYLQKMRSRIDWAALRATGAIGYRLALVLRASYQRGTPKHTRSHPANPGWNVGMALRALERSLLSPKDIKRPDVWLLLPEVRDGGDQQLLLSVTFWPDVSRLAGAGAVALSLRREGQPVYHPHEEAEGPKPIAREVPFLRDALGSEARAGALPDAAPLGERYRAPQGISRCAAD